MLPELAAGRHVVWPARGVVDLVQLGCAVGQEPLQGPAADNVAAAAAEAALLVKAGLIRAVQPFSAPDGTVRDGGVRVLVAQELLDALGVHVVVLAGHAQPVRPARRALRQQGGLLAGDRLHRITALRPQDVLRLPLVGVIAAAHGHEPALLRGDLRPRVQLGEQAVVVLLDGAGEDGVHHGSRPPRGDLADGVPPHGHRLGRRVRDVAAASQQALPVRPRRGAMVEGRARGEQRRGQQAAQDRHGQTGTAPGSVTRVARDVEVRTA
mmetsp:Transcript_16842/g.44566  ORF Transcript_16842/g.44566 Transcript_16842/m.44566 type:complete len:267 (-) Transcript_16842:17-817(-)